MPTAPAKTKTTLYITRRPHRVVKGEHMYSLTDDASGATTYIRDEYLSYAARSTAKGAKLASPLLAEVMIAARRCLKAKGGGTIIVITDTGEEIERKRVMGCQHNNVSDSLHMNLICQDCGQQF